MPTAPSRLVLLLPSASPLLPSILPPTISPTLTLLTPHPPALLTYLSQAYLVPIEASPRFWQILETAQSRHLAEDLAFKGEAGLDIGAGQGSDMVLQVLVRKAAGGSKGISRSLEALSPSSLGGDAKVVAVSSMMSIEPISAAPASTGVQGTAPPKTHADLDLPFNLTLTDQQKAARMGVPLPYAHEGEGAAVDLEIDEEEDEDDEEI
jgi:elongator complex protein 5